jgi:hypothetical protein
MGKAGESVGASGLYEARLHDIRPVIELRGADDSSFEAPDEDEEVSLLATSCKCYAHTTRVVSI